MLYVVDASVLIKWLIPEELSKEAERFVGAFRVGRLEFIAPDIVDAEVGHSLRRLVLNGELTVEAWFDAVADLISLDVPTVPSKVLVGRATRLALDHTASFYDALYVSLAVDRDCRVLTADQRAVRAFAGVDRLAPLGQTNVPP